MKKHILIYGLLISFGCSAQDWTGNLNSDWNNALNWSSLPLVGQDVTIDPTNYTGVKASPKITMPSIFIPRRVVVKNGGLLTINSILVTTEDLRIKDNSSSINIGTGTLTIGTSGKIFVSEGGIFSMGNGVINTDRLDLDEGSQFTLNGGTLNISKVLSLSDGNSIGNSLFKMNGGTLTIGQDIQFGNTIGAYTPTFDMSGGTLNVNGDVSWFGNSPGSGTPKFIVRGGNANINGNILNLPGSTVNINIRLSGNSNVLFNGTMLDMNRTEDSLIQTDNSILKFTNSNMWNNNGVFKSSYCTFFDNNTNLQGSGLFDFHTIVIGNTRLLNHIAPGNLNLTGNFINHGTIDDNSNTIIFNGSMPQWIDGSIPLAFNNLTINNSSSGVVFYNSVSVRGTLTLIHGLVTTNSVNMLTLLDNATCSAGSDLSFVNGPMAKVGDDSFVFPIGKGTHCRSLQISAPSSVNAKFVAEYFNTPHSNIASLALPLTSLNADEYWDLNQSLSNDACTATLFWDNSDGSNITSCSDLSMAEWNGTNWVNVPSIVSGNCGSGGTGNIKSISNLNAYRSITFGNSAVTTSIAEKNNSLFEMYPNPANRSDKLIIHSQEVYKTMEITDVLGKRVMYKKPDSANTEIILDALNPGIYYLKVENDQKSITRKLVIK